MDDVWLDTVRLARDCGDISSLFPPGITRIWDLPHTLFHAIRTSLHFLRFEELPRDEQPPKGIWLDEDKMKQWWREVEQAREDKYKNPNGGDYRNMPQNALIAEWFGKNVG